MSRTRRVEGDFPIWFVYTAGVAGEWFLRGLKEGKILASPCPGCKRTYCPPRVYCEDCFSEIKDTRPLRGGGRIESWTRLHVDLAGQPLKQPVTAAAIRLDGSTGVLVHRLVGNGRPKIGGRVSPVWAKERKGTLNDLEGFRHSGSS